MRTGVIILIVLAAIPAFWFIWRLKGIIWGANRIRIRKFDRSGQEMKAGDTGFALLKNDSTTVYFYPDEYSTSDDPAGSVEDDRIAQHLRAGGKCLFKVISQKADSYTIEFRLE